MTTVNYLHRKTDMRLTIVVKKYIGFNSSYMVTSIEYKKFSRETIADYKLNITVRQSRQSGVARATCPD